MNRREYLCGGVLLALVLAGCDSEALGRNYPPYRYRLALAVETPEGERTGASVIEVQWTEAGKAFGIQSGAGYSVRGEATAVDLPGGQTLFVLLRSARNPDWAAWALRDVVQNIKDQGESDRDPHPVPRQVELLGEQVDNYPYFVRFRDPADPKSVEQVAPDDLAASFGPGYRLKSLTVQVTDEAVTSGIGKRLPSYKAGSGFQDWYKSLPYGDPRRITLDDFQKGTVQ